MSKLVCHIEKNTQGNIFGLQKHEQRQNKNYSNKEIDHDKTSDNIDLLNNEIVNYKEKIEKIIAEHKTSTTKVKSNSIVMVSSIISSDQNFFKDLDHSEQLRFFKENLEFYKERFGEENLISANVHFDETTPHMHINFVPITQDGRLSGKDIINRNSLRQIQADLPKHLASKGFDIQRGLEATGVKHMKTIDYKKQLTELAKPIEQLDSMFRQSKLSKKEMIIAKENLDTIKTLVKSSLGVVDLKKDVDTLQKGLNEKERALQDVQEHMKLKDKLALDYKNQFDSMQDDVQKLKTEYLKVATALQKSQKKNELYSKVIKQINKPENLTTTGKQVVSNTFEVAQKELDNINKPTPNQHKNNIDMDM